MPNAPFMQIPQKEMAGRPSLSSGCHEKLTPHRLSMEHLEPGAPLVGERLRLIEPCPALMVSAPRGANR